jgi:hypothetical protein
MMAVVLIACSEDYYGRCGIPCAHVAPKDGSQDAPARKGPRSDLCVIDTISQTGHPMSLHATLYGTTIKSDTVRDWTDHHNHGSLWPCCHLQQLPSFQRILGTLDRSNMHHGCHGDFSVLQHPEHCDGHCHGHSTDTGLVPTECEHVGESGRRFHILHLHAVSLPKACPRRPS